MLNVTQLRRRGGKNTLLSGSRMFLCPRHAEIREWACWGLGRIHSGAGVGSSGTGRAVGTHRKWFCSTARQPLRFPRELKIHPSRSDWTQDFRPQWLSRVFWPILMYTGSREKAVNPSLKQNEQELPQLTISKTSDTDLWLYYLCVYPESFYLGEKSVISSQSAHHRKSEYLRIPETNCK